MPRFTGSLFIKGGGINAEGSSSFSGSLNILGPITIISGSIKGNTATPVITGSILSGTASLYSNPPSTTTTTSASYGINVVTTVSSQSYCVRLPQAVTGQYVSFVNKGGAPLYVFPSTASGIINGIVDGWFQVPNDNNTYTLVCIQNPSPGVWQSTTPTSTGAIFTSDIISASVGDSNSGYNILAFVNNNNQITGSNISNIPLINNPLNSSPITVTSIAGDVSAFVNPQTNVWTNINSVTFKTNISGSYLGSQIWNQQTQIDLLYRRVITYYSGSTNDLVLSGYLFLPYSASTWDPGFAAYDNLRLSFGLNELQSNSGLDINISSNQSGKSYVAPILLIEPGTFVSASNSDPYTSANPGDPGTLTFVVNNISPYASNYIGNTKLFTFVKDEDGLPYDFYYTAEMGFTFRNNSVSRSYPNLKIQTFYDVTL